MRDTVITLPKHKQEVYLSLPSNEREAYKEMTSAQEKEFLGNQSEEDKSSLVEFVGHQAKIGSLKNEQAIQLNLPQG